MKLIHPTIIQQKNPKIFLTIYFEYLSSCNRIQRLYKYSYVNVKIIFSSDNISGDVCVCDGGAVMKQALGNAYMQHSIYWVYSCCPHVYTPYLYSAPIYVCTILQQPYIIQPFGIPLLRFVVHYIVYNTYSLLYVCGVRNACEFYDSAISVHNSRE